MKKQQAGFTLIELVMVIVILGILAAFALPKFADLSQEARLATINGALGSVRSASAIVRAQYLANGSTGTSVSLEGTTVNITNGYADADNIDEAAQLSSDFSYSVTAGVGTVTLGNCSFTYTNATATAAPAISTVTGGPNC